MVNVKLVATPSSRGRNTAVLPDDNVLILRHSVAHRSDLSVTAQLNIARSIHLSEQSVQLKLSAQELIEESNRLRALAKATVHIVISGDNTGLTSGSSKSQYLDSTRQWILTTAE